MVLNFGLLTFYKGDTWCPRVLREIEPTGGVSVCVCVCARVSKYIETEEVMERKRERVIIRNWLT